jgi:16S rRNA (cytidine1402-2'-O)-methyltransferase
MVGPSSLLLALMASGLNGQHFAFHGYLPVDKTGRKIAIEAFEKESRKKNLTQLFIETPYRNNQLFQSLIENLSGNTLLCVATDITGQSESIKTKTVADWRRTMPGLPKFPTVFLFLAR